MGTVFKGGPSGNREDYLPPVPSSGQSQPVLNTAGNETQPGVYTKADDYDKSHFEHQTFPLPTSGGIPEGSTDVQEQGQPTSSISDAPSDIFKGAPNGGLKGGPAVPGR